METKICRACGLPKEIDEFRLHKTTKDGRQPKCKSCQREYQKTWYKEYRKSGREAAYRKEYHKKFMVGWRKTNQHYKDYRKAYYSEWHKRPHLRIQAKVSQGIRHALKGLKLGKHWEEIVGYTGEQLITHIENLFKPGMTWENYGGWHLDHIKPRCSFVIESLDSPGLKECWALSNLQPLWAAENLAKSFK